MKQKSCDHADVLNRARIKIELRCEDWPRSEKKAFANTDKDYKVDRSSYALHSLPFKDKIQLSLSKAKRLITRFKAAASWMWYFGSHLCLDRN